MNEERAQRWLAILVAVLTLVVLWETHQLHRLEFAERRAKRRQRGAGWVGTGAGAASASN